MPEEERPQAPARRLPSHTISDVLVPMSLALDLAEGRKMGHGQRVAYVAVEIARTLGLSPADRLAVLYAALFHDIGVIHAAAGMWDLVRNLEQRIFAHLPLLSPEEAAVESASPAPDIVAERIVDHTIHGGRMARELGLPEESVRGISYHHERWDGSGYPVGLERDKIPLAASIVSLADSIESVISQDTSPLASRRNLPSWLQDASGKLTDPKLAAAARSLTAGDTFWLGLFSASLPLALKAEAVALKEPRAMRIVTFGERFSEQMDARFSFTAGVSMRVARLAESLGRTVGFTEARLKQLRLAALLHDVGQLGIPERIMAKPGILSVEELEVLRQHPTYSREILAGIPGLEEVAEWAGAHHERPDGRGYPEGRTDIPLEARILAIADAYVAITSDRPHRPRADHEDGVRRLRGAAGSQLDADLLSVFVNRVVA